MKVIIGYDKDGWFYGTTILIDGFHEFSMKSDRKASFPLIIEAAVRHGHEVDNYGWKHKLLSSQWHYHAMDGYPGWEIEKERAPAFVKLTHVRGTKDVESSMIACAWDSETTVGFYQRDWTDSGIPYCIPGEIFWSGWWFETIAERDRFILWLAAKETL